jgi:hypothetical protein
VNEGAQAAGAPPDPEDPLDAVVDAAALVDADVLPPAPVGLVSPGDEHASAVRARAERKPIRRMDRCCARGESAATPSLPIS